MTKGICRGEYEDGNMSGEYVGGNMTREICRGEYNGWNMSGGI